MNKLSTWLIDKFREWEKSTGHRQSVTAFARYLKVKQPSLTRWMAGDNPPTGENVNKIAEKFGPEIFYILGLPRPDPGEEALLLAYRALPPDDKKALLDWADQYAARHGYRRIE